MQQQMQQDMASLQGGGAPATPPTPPTAMNPPPGQYSQWGNNPAPVTPPTPVQGPDGANIGAGNGAGNFNNWNPGAVNQYGGQQIAGATPSQADYQSVQGYADAAHQNARRYLDHQQDMQNRRMSQELINQGIDPNSAQGQERMKMLGMQQADANNAAAFGAMQFGQGIQNQMSQQELANRAGCTRQTIVLLEQGRYVPSLALAFRIARTFGATVEEVFEWNESGLDR